MNTQYDKLSLYHWQIMIKRKAQEVVTSCAFTAFLLKRCFYVLGSHLCGARYPKARAKLEKMDKQSKRNRRK